MSDSAAGSPMADAIRILLVSNDLMSASRIEGLARSLGARLETLRSPDAQPDGGPFDLVLLDLQACTGDAGGLVERVRALLEPRTAQAGTPVRIIAFGPHVHHQRLEEARSAGVTMAVSRGELLGDFASLVERGRR